MSGFGESYLQFEKSISLKLLNKITILSDETRYNKILT
jgi:hypothetical protein